MEAGKRAVKEIIYSRDFKELVQQHMYRVSKSNPTSESIRKQGDKIFKSHDHHPQIHEDTWKYYTLSAAVAENNSETLALSYSSRSAILIHMRKFEACIVDIDRALDITQDNCLRMKLLIRKVHCLYALDKDEAQNVLKETESELKNFTVPSLRKNFVYEINELKSMLNEIPQIYILSKDKKTDRLNDLQKKHPVNDFSSVQVESSKKFGRYLTATKDIQPGEVIYIEEPYLCCVNMKKMHAYCCHCFKTTWSNIPCDVCSWTMYCSEECKKDAWQKYHDIECSVYGWANDDESNDMSKQMALKAMILALKEYGGVENLEAQLLKWDKSTDNKEAFLADGKVKGNGFKSMYMMSGNATPELLKKHKVDTAKVLRSLGRNTAYFGTNFEYSYVEQYKNNENVLFLGALFLRLCTISQMNIFQMWNDSYKCRNNLDLNFVCWLTGCCSRGVYIAPITSLINHSCNPNVNRCYSNDHKIILYATQPIKKGAQIFHSYQELYYKCPRKIRREFLSHTYNFSCDCDACQKKWGELKDITMSEYYRKNPQEMLVIKSEFEHLIKTISNGHCDFNEKIIGTLAIGVDRSLAALDQPALYTIDLIKCLSTIFEKLYGIWLHVPSECNSM